MKRENTIFVSTTDVVVFCIAQIIICLFAGYQIEQHTRAGQVADFIRDGYKLDHLQAQNEQIRLENEQTQLDTVRLEKMRPVVESVYGYKNAVAKSERSGDD